MTEQVDEPDLEAIRDWAMRGKSAWHKTARWRGACYLLVKALDEILEGRDEPGVTLWSET